MIGTHTKRGKNIMTLKKINQKIKQAKTQLQKKLDKGSIYENFGQNEVRRIKDSVNIYTLDYTEREGVINAIDRFDDWCMNATPIYN